MPLKGAKKRSYNKKYYTDNKERISEKKKEAYQEDLGHADGTARHALGPLTIKIPTVVQSLLPDRRPLTYALLKQ